MSSNRRTFAAAPAGRAAPHAAPAAEQPRALNQPQRSGAAMDANAFFRSATGLRVQNDADMKVGRRGRPRAASGGHDHGGARRVDRRPIKRRRPGGGVCFHGGGDATTVLVRPNPP